MLIPISNNLKKVQKNRSDFYKFAKAHNLNVQWKMTTSNMEKAVNAFKKTKVNTIVKTLRKAKLNNDKASLKAINKTTGKVELQLNRFERIRKQIVAPADKKLLLHFKGENGSRNQYSSGADFDLDILPTTSVEVEWLNNPKRSRSEKKNFFRYLTKANYNLNDFQGLMKQ
ncbi:hypothetical protein GN244_ATG13588 [Phytophthora infestans]|uniref:Uncharacterized protein n=1 Tax=Phytophthora infestans TaxID=4787 RepID=A0A833W986_PHYIN|nr:hypothetical protein GN244_ATG13588 [Phytophthora infestans]